MVNEVSRAFGVWNRARIKTTLERVFELAPDTGVLDVPVTARLHLQLDLEHLDRQVAEELARAEVHLATSPTAAAPPALAGVSELAERLGVARSTVAGWIKGAADNGMPAPLARLQAGPVYDLEAVAAWHARWKAAPAPENA
jgi:transcriptional regulator with XRE-family HTH domain